ncbi:MAG: hypothetical protein AAGD17_03215 [Bacteroidota bacterium]
MLLKNRLLFCVLFPLLFQSCYTYKSIGIEDIKEGKLYSFQLVEGKFIEAKCKEVNSDYFLFDINQNSVKIPKNQIESVERKKVSVVKLLGGAALTTTAAILIFENGKEPIFVEEVSN